VNWLPAPYVDFGTMFVRLLGECPSDGQFRQELYDLFIEAYVDKVKKIIEDSGDVALDRTIRFAKTLHRSDS
jgi:hypothetical protein